MVWQVTTATLKKPDIWLFSHPVKFQCMESLYYLVWWAVSGLDYCVIKSNQQFPPRKKKLLNLLKTILVSFQRVGHCQIKSCPVNLHVQKKLLTATFVFVILCNSYHAVTSVPSFWPRRALDICKRNQVTFGQICSRDRFAAGCKIHVCHNCCLGKPRSETMALEKDEIDHHLLICVTCFEG